MSGGGGGTSTSDSTGEVGKCSQGCCEASVASFSWFMSQKKKKSQFHQNHITHFSTNLIVSVGPLLCHHWPADGKESDFPQEVEVALAPLGQRPGASTISWSQARWERPVRPRSASGYHPSRECPKFLPKWDPNWIPLCRLLMIQENIRSSWSSSQSTKRLTG